MSKWTWLYDDYARGTAFITDDPTDSQRAIVWGITPGDAGRIVDAHNAAVRADSSSMSSTNEAPEGQNQDG